MIDLTALLNPDTGCRMLPSPVNDKYFPSLRNIWHNFSSRNEAMYKHIGV